LLGGFASFLHGGDEMFMIAGAVVIAIMMFGWFGQVISDSQAGKYDAQVDTSFRMGMVWFIFSEVMFFAAFFGALFYVRQFAVPWIDGAGNNAATGELLWPSFTADWPLLNNPDAEKYVKPDSVIGAWGIPFYNTLILLTSGVTVTFAHWALKKGNKGGTTMWLFATVALGAVFVVLQAYEYGHAYQDLNLKLSSGIYGSTFFMLTGFHGLHVTIGAIMLFVMMIRSAKGHFSPKNHFAFEAAAWYWHFVDVVWLGLFIFVYWL
jgi:cytochrome c oxidase subunit 3